MKKAPNLAVRAGEGPCRCRAASGNRTPDLLITSEIVDGIFPQVTMHFGISIKAVVPHTCPMNFDCEVVGEVLMGARQHATTPILDGASTVAHTFTRRAPRGRRL